VITVFIAAIVYEVLPEREESKGIKVNK
jgi:hypothetical protein